MPQASVKPTLGLSHGQTPRYSPVATRAAASVVARRGRSGSESWFPRDEKPVLAGFGLMPTVPFDDVHSSRRARGTAASSGRCDSRCNSKSVSRRGSAASRGKASAAAERSSACHHFRAPVGSLARRAATMSGGMAGLSSRVSMHECACEGAEPVVWQSSQLADARGRAGIWRTFPPLAAGTPETVSSAAGTREW
jgi:hypothetical protein